MFSGVKPVIMKRAMPTAISAAAIASSAEEKPFFRMIHTIHQSAIKPSTAAKHISAIFRAGKPA